MPKDPSPLLGYNNNIRHKNRVFHVQTEDSGVRHPHIITHLFMDGGRILKSVKTSYAEHLGVEKMADLVRKMMKDQHKGMLIALRDGQFDQVIDGGEAPKPSPQPPVVEASSTAAVPLHSAPTLDALPATHAPTSQGPASRPPSSQRAPVSAGPASAPKTERGDLGEFGRAPTEAPPPSFQPAPSDLEPPPANLFRPRSGGNYSEVGASAEPPKVGTGAPPPLRHSSNKPPVPVGGRPPVAKPSSLPPGAVVSRSSGGKPSAPSPALPRQGAASAPPRPPIRRGSSPPPPPVPEVARSGVARRPPLPVAAKPTESRYASARPAAIFGQSRPRGGSSIFGEDIISDKSLDEVIMSYLADDGGDKPSDPKRRK